mgnify:FL=1
MASNVTVTGLDHIVLLVADVERSLAWYRDVLGLTVEREPEWRAGEVAFPSVRIDAGTIIDLVRAERTGRNVDHVALRVAPDVDLRALAHSGRFDVIELRAEVWGAAGSGTSLYVRDPDDNTVELKHYAARV